MPGEPKRVQPSRARRCWPYLRRSVDEYDAIRDSLLGLCSRPELGSLPDRAWTELLIGLTPGDEGAIETTVWQGAEELAEQSVRRPALLDPSYRPAATDQAVAEVGRAAGLVLFPEPRRGQGRRVRG